MANAKAGTPLLYVLRNDFELSGPKFGCGLAQCGSCRMIVNDEITASCVVLFEDVAGKSVETLRPESMIVVTCCETDHTKATARCCIAFGIPQSIKRAGGARTTMYSLAVAFSGRRSLGKGMAGMVPRRPPSSAGVRTLDKSVTAETGVTRKTID
ncbi:hypothetical protein [Mesorhizobium sp. M0047]|uniref:hypothetical protein n=1 Tax=Mesorhizobium sp. M0047 TaxID=2956859 RepID=UPI00333E03AD